MTDKTEEKQRPIEELFIEKYFGFTPDMTEDEIITSSYGDFVNLLTMFKESLRVPSPSEVSAEEILEKHYPGIVYEDHFATCEIIRAMEEYKSLSQSREGFTRLELKNAMLYASLHLSSVSGIDGYIGKIFPDLK